MAVTCDDAPPDYLDPDERSRPVTSPCGRGRGVLRQWRAVRESRPALPGDPRRPRAQQCGPRDRHRRVPARRARRGLARRTAHRALRLRAGGHRDRHRLGRRARIRVAGRDLDRTRRDHVRCRSTRRGHRRRDERTRASCPAALWTVDRELVSRHLEHRGGDRRSHGCGDAGPRRVVGRRAAHGVGAVRRRRVGQLPVHASRP